jgi:sugar phosphate isomerase/epimerase
MKLSTSIFLTDLLPQKRKLFHKIVKNRFFGSNKPQETLHSLQKLGLEGVELMIPSYLVISDRDFLEAKHVLDSCSLPVFSIHQQLRFVTKTRIAEIVHLFHVADLLQAKVIVLHISNAGKQLFDTQYVTLLHSLERKYGIIVGFENMERYIGGVRHKRLWHGDTFAHIVRENDFHITLDTTHLAHSGGDILSFFQHYKESIINIHLSDYRKHFFNGTIRPLRYKHMALGEGELPLREFLLLLKKEQYHGLLTLEMHTDFEGIRKSIEMIHSIFMKKS